MNLEMNKVVPVEFKEKNPISKNISKIIITEKYDIVWNRFL